MNPKIQWLGHDCFCIQGSKTVYIDPFQLKRKEPKADFILITHDHFDHCSPEDIAKIKTEKTIVIAARKAGEKLGNSKRMLPGEHLQLEGITVSAIPAYNVNKFRSPGEHFHPKNQEHIGFVFETDGKKYYHAGDTDFIPEMKQLKGIDVAFLPISGTYVMTPEEAAEAANTIRAKTTIPMHYGSIIAGEKELETFRQKTMVPIQVLKPEK